MFFRTFQGQVIVKSCPPPGHMESLRLFLNSDHSCAFTLRINVLSAVSAKCLSVDGDVPQTKVCNINFDFLRYNIKQNINEFNQERPQSRNTQPSGGTEKKRDDIWPWEKRDDIWPWENMAKYHNLTSLLI